MTRRFGDRARFAVEVGEVWPPPPALATGDLRTVDLWAGGAWLTTFDNTAYVPSFTHYMRSDAEQVRRRDIRPCPFPGHSPEEVCRLLYAEMGETDFSWQFRLMDWGPTTDDATCIAYLDAGDELVLTLVRREDNPSPEDPAKVVVAKILADEFVAVLTEASDLLDAERVQ
ncbi:hypothetical protein [Actinoplanes utahensis]|uniref:Uncharacterized protein n=1 Tax=Actinoplanes utahensis TaxID=1869 RepID=A0A0A6UFW6_ACTUT|nr:hypothetical protein [Actinoplanes utahensis]KHD73983.1 hypothetical protein MB27_31450 [Actinoplanes utahensis]GIF35636.1 hypothetical protein Aut01nite_86220 [Actinoplanes utahensis]